MKVFSHDLRSPDSDSSGSLLRGLLVLRHFDENELSAYAGVEVSVVQAFLSEHSDWLEVLPMTSGAGRWKLRLDCVSTIRGLADAPTADEGERGLTMTSPYESGRSPNSGELSPCGWESEMEEYFCLAMSIVNEEEQEASLLPADTASATRLGLEPSDAVDGTRSRKSRLEAASMYLARCEATLWPLQAGRQTQDDLGVHRLLDLRTRLDVLRRTSSPATDSEREQEARHSLQDWSVSLPNSLAKLNTSLPEVLRTFTAEDLAHWIAGDLGLSSPWYQASARAAASKKMDPSRWPDVRSNLVAHFRSVLRLPSCSAALASIGMIAATIEAGELTRPLLAAFLLSNAHHNFGASARAGRIAQERAIFLIALNRLCQQPRLEPRVNIDAALACELLLAGGSSDDFELLAPGVMLREMIQDRPWLDRINRRGRDGSALFYCNLVKAIFIAARDSATRTSLSKTLASSAGQALVAELFRQGAAHRHDSASAYLLVPCEKVQRSLEEEPSPGQVDLDQLTLLGQAPRLDSRAQFALPLSFLPGSEEGVLFSAAQGVEDFHRGMNGEPGGIFSKALSTREMTPAIEAMFSPR